MARATNRKSEFNITPMKFGVSVDNINLSVISKRECDALRHLVYQNKLVILKNQNINLERFRKSLLIQLNILQSYLETQFYPSSTL